MQPARRDTQQPATREIGHGHPAEARQIGKSHEIRENVVTVEPHQGVGVEQQRTHARHEQHVEAQVAHRAGAADTPRQRGHRRYHQLDVHAGRGHCHALPGRTEAPRGCDVDVGHRHKEHQDHARLSNAASIASAGQAVCRLVNEFECQPACAQPESAVQIEDLASASCQSLVLGEQTRHCRRYQHPPANDKPGMEEPMADPGQTDKPVLRMDQGNAGHQGIIPRQAGSHGLCRRPCCLACRTSRLQQLRVVQPAHDGCRFHRGERFLVQHGSGLRSTSSRVRRPSSSEMSAYSARPTR